VAKRYLYFDIESGNAGTQWGKRPEDFVRLFQFSWDEGPVELVTDYNHMLSLVREADYVVGHNIINYDLSVIFGQDSVESLEMCLAQKVIDTFVVAALVAPAPYSYTNAAGHTFYDAAKPESAMAWLSLANLCYQFGIEGKLGDLTEIAKKYNPPGTAKRDLDYSLIPLDDPEFRAYAIQDVVAVRGLWKYLRALIQEQDYDRAYIWREHKIAGIEAQISRNGVKVDREAAQKRVDELLLKRDELMAHLVRDYDFPTEGKSPWASGKGKDVILHVLAEHGITVDTHPEWPLTPTGAPKLGGKELIQLTAGTEAEEFGSMMAMLKGQRSLAQLALDSIHPDGLAHPEITSLQRSGRWSMTKPGLTVWTKNEEKKYFVAREGKIFAELDYSAADARAVGALSGDPEFLRRFYDDSKKAHDFSGEVLFGNDKYWADRDTMYPAAKQGGHSQNYNIGAFTLAMRLNETCMYEKIDLHFWAPATRGQKEIPHKDGEILAKTLIDNFNAAYPWLKRFKDAAVQEGESGWIVNTWGRRMRVDDNRAYTQGPALYGQSTTREMMADALIRLAEKGEYCVRSIVAIIHDALWTELDEATAEADVLVIKECMEAVFDPKTQVSEPILFPVEIGPLGRNWYDCSH